jgi:hypothetical protein
MARSQRLQEVAGEERLFEPSRRRDRVDPVSEAAVGVGQLATGLTPLTATRVLALQRTVGNAAVTRMLHASTTTVHPVVVQRRRAASRGGNRRTYRLSGPVRDHIFTNSNDGTGFHSVARNPANLTPHVHQIDAANRDRGAQVYQATHHDNGGQQVAAGKTMFPDGWDEARIVDVIERALTRVNIPVAERVRMNQVGATAANNRPLPPAAAGPVRGRADGVRVEGLFQAGQLATVYPVL